MTTHLDITCINAIKEAFKGCKYNEPPFKSWEVEPLEAFVKRLYQIANIENPFHDITVIMFSEDFQMFKHLLNPNSDPLLTGLGIIACSVWPLMNVQYYNGCYHLYHLDSDISIDVTPCELEVWGKNLDPLRVYFSDCVWE